MVGAHSSFDEHSLIPPSGLIAILIGYMVARAIRKAAMAGGQKYLILAAMFVLAAEPMAMLVAIVAGFRAFEKTAVRTDRRTPVTFIGLMVLLSVLSARVAAIRR